jgi:hypothetical protein
MQIRRVLSGLYQRQKHSSTSCVPFNEGWELLVVGFSHPQRMQGDRWIDIC